VEFVEFFRNNDIAFKLTSFISLRSLVAWSGWLKRNIFVLPRIMTSPIHRAIHVFTISEQKKTKLSVLREYTKSFQNFT